jgi:signal peptidase I
MSAGGAAYPGVRPGLPSSGLSGGAAEARLSSSAGGASQPAESRIPTGGIDSESGAGSLGRSEEGFVSGNGVSPERVALSTEVTVSAGAPDSGEGDNAAEGADAGSDEEKSDGKKKSKDQRSFWKELPILVVVALVLAVIIKTFAVQAFFIPSGSMENTLRIGDRILVNKIVYHTRSIHRGDIVVFKVPSSWEPETSVPEPSNPISRVLHDVGGFFGVAPTETDYIKRVIGLPGDHVSCAGNGAPVLVNGHPLQESSYLYPGNAPSIPPFNVVVPKGGLWVMGDHRADSGDSRLHPEAPFVPESRVIGRAFVVVWPVSDWQVLSIPGTFQQPGLAAAALPATPVALGFVIATPLFVLNRRRRRSNSRSS